MGFTDLVQAPGPAPAVEEGPEIEGSPETKESPKYVRTSLGAAIALGFSPGSFYRDAMAYCINLLLTYRDGCKANCAYCGLSHSRAGEYAEKSFIRVKWPVVRVSEVAERIREIRKIRKTDGTDGTDGTCETCGPAGPRGEVRRVCISMVTHPRAAADVVRVAMAIRSRSDVPISGLLTPTTLTRSDLEAMKSAGIDRIGIAIDAATEGLFDVLRGHGVQGPHRWERYWRALAEAVEVFGRWMVGCHLIVGLGETQREMAGAIQMAHDMGVFTHLFAFYPEYGSALERHDRPSLECYRRIQLARYIINEGIARYEDFSFDDRGAITGYGIPRGRLQGVVGLGLPFVTSGCPGRHGELGCNRPYANERPGEPIRNYPFLPDEQDIEEIKAQLGLSI